MRRDRAGRALRGFTAAGVATFAALFGHVAGGGTAPGWLGVLVPLVLSLPITVLLAGRRLSLLRLTLSVGASQLLFHLLFVLGSPRQLVGSGPGHHHGAVSLVFADGAPVALGGDVAMSAGHLLGALVTIAALHRGERALAAILDLTRRALDRVRPGLAAPAPARAPRAVPAHVAPPARLPLGVLVAAIPHRGPPFAVAF